MEPLSQSTTLTEADPSHPAAAAAAAAAEIVITGANDPALLARLARIDKADFKRRQDQRRRGQRGPFCGGKWPKRTWPVVALFVVVVVPPAVVLGCYEAGKREVGRLKERRGKASRVGERCGGGARKDDGEDDGTKEGGIVVSKTRSPDQK